MSELLKDEEPVVTDALLGSDTSNTGLNALSNLAERPDASKWGLHPPGTIALPCGELGRYNAFTYSLATLRYPDRTRVAMAKGISIPRNLNSILKEMHGEWVWLIGDDHVFDAEIILRLLDRDVDVVVPLCIRRQPPFAPVIFKNRRPDGMYEPFAYDEIPDNGLFEIYAAGTAGMLIKRHVLDAIGYPWFENGSVEMATEDLEFCRKIKAAGFKIHADANNLIGHIGGYTIWPKRHGGRWGFLFDYGPGPDGAMNQMFINVGERQAREREETGTVN